jgi:hypothetical protein
MVDTIIPARLEIDGGANVCVQGSVCFDRRGSLGAIDELDDLRGPRFAAFTDGDGDLIARVVPPLDDDGARSEEFVVLVFGLAFLVDDRAFQVNQGPANRVRLSFQSFYLREGHRIGVAPQLHLQARCGDVDEALFQSVVEAQRLPMPLDWKGD